MGQSNSQFIYSLPTNNKVQGESQIYRNPKSFDDLQWQPEPQIFTLQDVIEQGYQKFKNIDFQGSFNYQSNKFEYITYGQTYEQARQLGSAIYSLNLFNQVNEYKDYNLKVVGIYSKNRPEWNITDMACILYGYTSIPLYDSLGPQSISYALSNSSVSTLLCTEQTVQTILKTENIHLLKNVVLYDDISDDLKEQIKTKGLLYYSYKDLLKQGQENIVPLPKVQSDDIFTFSYTSGTTGLPKGAMISHKNFVGLINNFHTSNLNVNENDIQMCYLPLTHIFQRAFNSLSWYYGMKIAFFRGDVSRIKDDLQMIQPTLFFSVPRIFNRFYHLIQDSFKQKSILQNKIIDLAVRTKLNNYYKYGLLNHQIFDPLVFKKIKQLFGGRLKFCFTASAPLSRNVLDFFKIALGIPFVECYGQTEGTGLEFLTETKDTESGHVGGIQTSLEFKVVDIPEMNYFSTDVNEKGENIPRGEICVRGHTVFPGYYKDDERTKEALDEDGWLHSGDVGVILPGGQVKIIDRKKNIFKLSQGEYIAPEKVETIYMRLRTIQEIFIYGDSFQNFCVAIVVPNPDELKSIGKQLNIQDDEIKELCKNQQIVDYYQNIMDQHAKKEGLYGFEQAKKIYIEPVSMLLHGCMTNTMKLQRHQAKLHFKEVINKLYEETQ